MLSQRLSGRFHKLLRKSNGEMLKEMIRAKLKVCDHNTVLGMVWVFLGPLSMLLVLYLLFREHFGRDIEDYPLYLLIGIICVNFFVTATTYLTRAFHNNREALLNTTIPREDFFLSELFMYTYKFLIELAFCLILSAVYGHFSWISLLGMIPLLLAYAAFVLGTSLVLTIVYCFVRDIEHLWMLLGRLLIFITPIFYSPQNLPPLTKELIYLNPLTPFVQSFRDLLMGGESIVLAQYLYSLLLGGVVLAGGYLILLKFESPALERV